MKYTSQFAIIGAMAILMAAFAGIMLVADEDVAAEGEGAGEFKVTYSFDGSSVVKTMDANNKFKFENLSTVKAPTGYMLTGWKDVKSGAVYDFEQTYTFSGDVTVEPVYSADRAIIKLVYGDVVYEIMDDKSVKEAASTGGTKDAENTFTQTISYEKIKEGLTEFAKKLGMKEGDYKFELMPSQTTGASAAYTGVKISEFKISGYEFKGFVLAGSESAEPVKEITRAASAVASITPTTGSGEQLYTYSFISAEVLTYTLVMEKVYDVTFIVEGAQIDKVKSNDLEDGIIGTSAKGFPVAPVKDNYIFIGWYNAAGEKVVGYSVDKKEYTFVPEDFKFTEDTVLYAKFVPLTYTVTFVYGEAQTIFETETVKYGEKAIEPKGLPEGYKGWDFDFSAPITEDTVIVAVEADPVTIYNVTFKIEGKSDIMQKSDSMVVPDTNIEGKVFKGWLVEGQTQYVDPMNYEITEDVVFVAVYDKAPEPAGPGFFETNEGKCVAVIIGVILIAFVYAVYTNMFGMKDFLTSFKVQRVKKE